MESSGGALGEAASHDDRSGRKIRLTLATCRNAVKDHHLLSGWVTIGKPDNVIGRPASLVTWSCYERVQDVVCAAHQ